MQLSICLQWKANAALTDPSAPPPFNDKDVITGLKCPMSFTANPSKAGSLVSGTAQLLEAPPQLRVEASISETIPILGQESLYCPK